MSPLYGKEKEHVVHSMSHYFNFYGWSYGSMVGNNPKVIYIDRQGSILTCGGLQLRRSPPMVIVLVKLNPN